MQELFKGIRDCVANILTEKFSHLSTWPWCRAPGKKERKGAIAADQSKYCWLSMATGLVEEPDWVCLYEPDWELTQDPKISLEPFPGETLHTELCTRILQ